MDCKIFHNIPFKTINAGKNDTEKKNYNFSIQLLVGLKSIRLYKRLNPKSFAISDAV